jgi:glycosyltransferase involved in cell wall biosynthesis
MKILFLNNFKKRGGGEEFLRELLPGLTSKGAEVGLVCRPDTPLADMFRNSDVVCHPIWRSGLSIVSAVLKTAKVIRMGEYDIINIQRGHDIAQAWLAAKLSGKSPVLMYTPQVPEFMRSRFLLSRMDKIVTISRYIKDRVVSFFPAIAPRISIIYYGINLEKFNRGNIRRGALRRRFGLQPDVRIIGTVGDLWKNQIEFLDAFVSIKRDFPDARFAIVSSESGGNDIELFKRRVAQLGLTDAVLWVGRLSKDDMFSFYADIDIAVNTHRKEGFGIWVIEALASGTPVVSVNEGGVRDSLEGCPAGVMVDGGSDKMAGAVISILKDASLHAKMSTAGPQWVAEHFGRERMIQEYYGFFQSLIRE